MSWNREIREKLAEKYSEKSGEGEREQTWVELWDLKQVMSEGAAVKPVKTDKVDEKNGIHKLAT